MPLAIGASIQRGTQLLPPGMLGSDREDIPVTGRVIEAFNLGYLRSIGSNSRIAIDYRLKDDVTFNDDELNTKFSLTWNVEYSL